MTVIYCSATRWGARYLWCAWYAPEDAARGVPPYAKGESSGLPVWKHQARMRRALALPRDAKISWLPATYARAEYKDVIRKASKMTPKTHQESSATARREQKCLTVAGTWIFFWSGRPSRRGGVPWSLLKGCRVLSA